jgi:hypothetical protein
MSEPIAVATAVAGTGVKVLSDKVGITGIIMLISAVDSVDEERLGEIEVDNSRLVVSCDGEDIVAVSIGLQPGMMQPKNINRLNPSSSLFFISPSQLSTKYDRILFY